MNIFSGGKQHRFHSILSNQFSERNKKRSLHISHDDILFESASSDKINKVEVHTKKKRKEKVKKHFDDHFNLLLFYIETHDEEGIVAAFKFQIL